MVKDINELVGELHTGLLVCVAGVHFQKCFSASQSITVAVVAMLGSVVSIT